MTRVFAAACAATCLTLSTAYAGGPVVLDDASMDQVTAAGVVDFDTIITKTVDHRQDRHLQHRKERRD